MLVLSAEDQWDLTFTLWEQSIKKGETQGPQLGHQADWNNSVKSQAEVQDEQPRVAPFLFHVCSMWCAEQ